MYGADKTVGERRMMFLQPVGSWGRKRNNISDHPGARLSGKLTSANFYKQRQELQIDTG